jgi:2-oxoglutarate dehydrogenase complex dehydrogenase (E1) component-like enzyme
VLQHLADVRGIQYVGRDARAATAEGYGSTHKRVQAALVREAVDGAEPASGPDIDSSRG